MSERSKIIASDAESPQRAIRWGVFALVLSTGLMVAKLAAYAVTGSTAVLSDALESIVNIVTSSFALYAVWLSAQPSDTDHPYGHGRIEYIATALEAVALGVAGVAIMVVAIIRYSDGAVIVEVAAGIPFVVAISVVALLGGTVLVAMGRKLSSSTLVADGEHIRADAYTTFATLAALVLIELTGMLVFDFVFSVLIGGWLIFHAVRIMRGATESLMDRANPDLLDELADMLESIREPGWIAPHRTKVQNLGQEIHVDIHMVFPRYWDLEETHRCANLLEEALEARFGPRSDMMVHMEPCTDNGCSTCDKLDCPIRKQPFEGRIPWTGRRIAQVERRRD